MCIRPRLSILILCGLAAVACGSQTPHSRRPTRWPTRTTPLSSTLGWFRAINSHNRRRLLFYVAPDARDQMGWARPSTAWSRFTDLRCRRVTLPVSTRTRVYINCSFNESASADEGNPDSFWNVQLERTDSGWLIDSYGQG